MKEKFFDVLKIRLRRVIEKKCVFSDGYDKKVDVCRAVIYTDKYLKILEYFIVTIGFFFLFLTIFLLDLYMRNDVMVVFVCGGLFSYIVILITNLYDEIKTELKSYVIKIYSVQRNCNL